jgi:hypothetical protein
MTVAAERHGTAFCHFEVAVLRIKSFASALLFLCGTGAAVAEVTAQASYVVSLGGINVASVKVNLDEDGEHYALDLKANVEGIGQLVASGTASIESAGVVNASILQPQRFGLATKANGETFSVAVGYAGGDVTSFTVEPPVLDNFGRVPLERSQLTGVGDILASFVFRGGSLDASLCKRKMAIFTGVERFNIKLSYIKDDEATSARTGYQGPVVLCNIGYTPISGHFTTSEMTSFLADSDRILIWYAPLGDTGYFIPYRLLMTTAFGDLSMVLTGAKS